MLIALKTLSFYRLMIFSTNLFTVCNRQNTNEMPKMRIEAATISVIVFFYFIFFYIFLNLVFFLFSNELLEQNILKTRLGTKSIFC